MRVLMLPSMHPYVAKLSCGDIISIVNPNSDYFSEPEFGVDFIQRAHDPNSYDIVHIHFSFDKVNIDNLKDVLAYFKQIRKPIVWTCHSKESQRIHNYCNGEYQKLLYTYSDKVITLTEGCKKWMEQKWGKHSNSIEVIAHGLIAMPDVVRQNIQNLTKKRNRFTILYGEFRENKERIKAVSDFLSTKYLEDAELHLIYKTCTQFQTDNTEAWESFMKITDNMRCSRFVKLWITNEELIKEFYLSHCVILPYLWGTHSGQIELAKDCGCYVIAPNVGFYKEQWEKTILWGENCKNRTYIDALKEAYNSQSLAPIGDVRIGELEEIIERHLIIYQTLLQNVIGKPI